MPDPKLLSASTFFGGLLAALFLLASVSCDRHPKSTTEKTAPSAEHSPHQTIVSALDHDDGIPPPLFRGYDSESLGGSKEILKYGTYFMFTQWQLERANRELQALCGVTFPDSAGTFVGIRSEDSAFGGIAHQVTFRMPAEDVTAYADRVYDALAGDGSSPRRWHILRDKYMNRKIENSDIQ